jgi:hypothetical protein
MTTRERVHRAAVLAIAIGNVAFGLAAVLAPQRVGALLDEPEDAVRRTGQRNLAAGLALASSQKRPVAALALNALSDLRDGLKYLKTKPLAAAPPLLWAALAVVAIATRENDAD